MLVQWLIQKQLYIYEVAKTFCSDWNNKKLKNKVLAWCKLRKSSHFWRTVHSQAVATHLKKSIVILLIFISCSSIKEFNSTNSIIKNVEKIEKNLCVLEKKVISLENLYSFEFGNYATSFKDKSEIRKIEYNLSSWSYTFFDKDNMDELLRMRYREDLISIVGEIYLYENKPILIKEKITRDPALLMSPPKNIQTGEVGSYTQVINQDEEFNIYIQNWDKSEIIIENLFGSFTKWDFKKDFYNDIIEEVKKQE